MKIPALIKKLRNQQSMLDFFYIQTNMNYHLATQMNQNYFRLKLKIC